MITKKMTRDSSHNKRYKKDIEKGGNEKRKVYEKFNDVTTTIKFFTFIFYIWKRIYFGRRHSLGKFSLYYYISSKGFLVLQDI